jgi:hypothetical protein
MANILQMIGSGLGRAGAAVGRGLGRVSETLYPVDPSMAGAITPQQLAALRKGAMLRMGLGMMAAGEEGAGLGGSILTGLQMGGGPLDQFIATAYGNAEKRRAEEKEDSRYESEREYRLKRDEQQFTQRQAEQQAAQERWQAEMDATAEWRKTQAELDRERLAASTSGQRGLGAPPSGFMWTPEGNLTYIPGGPADPAVASANRYHVPTEDERRSAGLAVRMENALAVMNKVGDANKDSLKPSVGAAVAGSIPMLGETLRNVVNTTDRQRIESAQRDALDAALTLATGAAYTKEQLNGLLRSYFPQIGDSDTTIAEKQARFQSVIETARIRAGRAAGSIDPVTGEFNATLENDGIPPMLRRPSPEPGVDDVASRARSYYQ